MKIFITGSLGLVGSEAAHYFLFRGHQVTGVDNDMRRHFFGEEASVAKNMIHHPNYGHYGVDISKCEEFFVAEQPDVVIHCAAQPSHDWAAKNPMLDFGVNAYSTLMMLEMTRKHRPRATFIYVSTNKVYGDAPNRLPLSELEKRYEYLDPMSQLSKGIDETMSVDQCLHSIFGVSKLSGDLMVQEYGRYFGMKTAAFRCGCITGAKHAGAELHGFLSYLVRCKKEGIPYKIYGYKGKQVRDNLHAYDLVSAFDQFIENPRCGEVYNMGGGRHSNISVLEAIEKIGLTDYEYVDAPRIGDHQWYVSDVSKFQSHYPEWKYTYDIDKILEDLLK